MKSYWNTQVITFGKKLQYWSLYRVGDDIEGNLVLDVNLFGQNAQNNPKNKDYDIGLDWFHSCWYLIKVLFYQCLKDLLLVWDLAQGSDAIHCG